jgi:predicted enzyme related to lactoylglutathione lyase
MDHSQVKGGSKDPARYVLNFEVDDIEKTVESLDSTGVKKVQDTYHIEGYGYAATYEDPDGNNFQVVQVREG